MSKKALPVIIITVCLLFAGCKAPADQEQKNNTETADIDFQPASPAFINISQFARIVNANQINAAAP